MIQNKIKKVFSRFDFLDLKPDLLFYSRTRHITWIGIIMSLINFCLIGTFAIFFIVQLFQRQYLVVTSSTLTSNNPILNLTGIPVMFTLVDGNYNPLPDAEKVYSFQFQPINRMTNAKGESFIFKFEACNITKHFSEYERFFNNINVSKYQCPVDLDQWNVTLAGAYGVTDDFKFQSLIINRCENTTNSSKCYPKDVIETKILSVYIQMGFLDYEVNNLDYKDPVKPHIKIEAFPLSGTIFKRYYQYRKQAQYDSDDGFILSELRTKQYHQYDKTEISVDLRVALKFGTINTVLSSNIQYTKRVYLKFQDVVASIGGVLNLLIFISSVIVHFLTQKQLYLALGNENFNFDMKIRDGEEQENLKAKQPFNEIYSTEKHEGNVSEIEINFPLEKTEPIQLPYQTNGNGREYVAPPIKKKGEISSDKILQTSENPLNFMRQMTCKREKMNEKQSKFIEEQTLNIGPKVPNKINEPNDLKILKLKQTNVSKKGKNTRERRPTIDAIGKIKIDWKAKFCPFLTKLS